MKEQHIHSILNLVLNTQNIFKRYDVDRFLHTNGILVTPQYRGRGICEQLLKLNMKICVEFGLNLALAVLTSNTSNTVGQKAGYAIDRALR